MRCRTACVGIPVLLILLCTAVSTSQSESYSGPTQPVPAAFFGMHIHRAAGGTPWPPVPFADWRLWDANVAWPQLERKPGKWDFTLLDRYVQIAADRHVEILLTLGLTPTWASARPDEASAYGKGNAAEPRRLADWEEYVRVVATRYKGRIREYEIWNEPNVKGTFTGSTHAMLDLSRSAYRVLKSVDAGYTVVSPAPTADNGVSWLREFLQEGSCQYFDVLGYHLYVTPESPEAMVPLVRRVRATLLQQSCADKPLWNTESGWAKPKQFTSDDEAAGYLMRTYLLNWLLGVERCYWYAWDNRNWSTLALTSPSSNQMTSVGAAYGIVHGWMLGAVLRSCSRAGLGLWACDLKRGTSTGRILWTEQNKRAIKVPPDWQVREDTSWKGEVSRPTAVLMIGPAPVLLTGN